jgi:hypothetical protein
MALKRSTVAKIEMEVAILYNKANEFGLKQDAEILRQAFKHVAPGKVKIREADPLEPPVSVDLAIHLEVPVYGWMPWSSVNVLLCNVEWYETSWNPYLYRFDAIVFRCKEDEERFWKQFSSETRPPCKSYCLPWACLQTKEKKQPQSLDTKDGFVWFLGGSVNKREAATHLLPQWKPSYPPLHVYTTKELDVSVPSYVSVTVRNLDSDERKRLAAWYPGHLCWSQAESYGYTAAEAETNGAFMILNDLDVYVQDYKYTYGVEIVSVPKEQRGLASFAKLSDYVLDLDTVMAKFTELDMKDVRKQQKNASEKRYGRFLSTFGDLWNEVYAIISVRKATKPKHLPPVLSQIDCPPISVVTLLYNRRKFFDLACHNIMLSDYPKEKIEWVIVEDSDDPQESASDRVIQVGLKSSPLTVVYVPLEKKTPISEKRNLGVKRAKNDIILFMDDDDHYPETSFRRRVAWLTKHPWKPQCVSCTTIACYDLLRGVSAVNTPPWNLPLGQRISEATMAFYKSWWETRHFAFKQDIAEGEKFVEGREHEVLELPPQQIIVAFSHKKNTSGRRIPADDAKPGCFWGFPKEFLIYIHKLVGVEVEEAK